MIAIKSTWEEVTRGVVSVFVASRIRLLLKSEELECIPKINPNKHVLISF